MDGNTIKISPEQLAAGNVASYQKGYDTGHAEGRRDGYTTGYAEGREDGHREGMTQAGEQLESLRKAVRAAETEVGHHRLAAQAKLAGDEGAADEAAAEEWADDKDAEPPAGPAEPETISQLRARLFPGVDVPEAGQFAVVMDPEIRALWAAALLSGQYGKGKTRLHREDGWCCLGVKCDLYVKAGHADLEVRTELDAGIRTWFYGTEEAFPPSLVTMWSGSARSNPTIPEHVLLVAYPSRHYNDLPVPGTSASYYGPGATLSALNDADADIPFEHIAWLILGRPDLIAAQVAEQMQA